MSAALAAAPMNVAVLYFDNNTGRPEYDVLRKGLADMLVTDLAAVPALQVVERDRLESVLAEQKLQRSKAFDAKTAVKLGRLVGASHAVTGAIAAVEPQLRFDIRLVNVQTGAVVAGGQVTGAKDDVFGSSRSWLQKFLSALDEKMVAHAAARPRSPT